MKRGAEMKISKLPPLKVYLFTLKMEEFYNRNDGGVKIIND